MTKKILVIDDEVDLRGVLKDMLELRGYDVKTAVNGEEGLDKVRDFRPDLVLLDVGMPGMDGFEFFKAVRSDPGNNDMYILMLTAHSSMKDTFDALDADGFIPKPYNIEDIADKVKFLLSKKTLLLGDSAYITGKVGDVAGSCGHVMCTAQTERQFLIMAGETRFDVLVAYLPLVTMDPAGLLNAIRNSKSARSKLIIYSDSNVPGTEHNEISAIEEMSVSWLQAGADEFYDKRMEYCPFIEIFQKTLDT